MSGSFFMQKINEKDDLTMAETKKYSGKVGIKGFYYAILEEDTKDGALYGEPVHVPHAQSIGIETEQEIVKAFGDNTVAEMVTSTGVTTLTMGFHALPLSVKQDLLGLEEEDGLTVQKSNVSAPYVAIALEQTKADGSSEMVGLTKGMFMLPSQEGATKEDTTEFQSQEIEGEFSARTFDDVTQIFAEVPKDDAEGIKDKFNNKLFQNEEVSP